MPPSDHGTAQFVIEPYGGPRDAILHLFELADDSAVAVRSYMNAGDVIVAVREGTIVGHAQILGNTSDLSLELKSLAVLEEHRRFGIGRALVEAALDRARRRSSPTVRVSTATADIDNLRFYQRLGFRMHTIERDAFTPSTGYADIVVDGIPLRDRVWLDRAP